MEFPKLMTESGKGKKTRCFTVRRLAYLQADALWEPKKGKAAEIRPALLCYFGSRAETQAFSANLMAGRPAVCGQSAFLIERKAGYRRLSQEVPGGIITTLYLPQLFHLEPVQEPQRVEFVFAPPRWWVREQARELRLDVPGEDPEELAQAALFCAFLDRRTSMPLLRDPRFQLRLFEAARNESFTTRPGGRRGQIQGAGLEACGLVSPLAVSAQAQTIVTFIQEQIAQYKENSHGTSRGTAAGRLLSYPEAPTEQLGFDFAVAG